MLKRIARVVVRLMRWKIEGELPPHPKMVMVGAPHTSNWDFPLAMVFAPALGVRIRFLGKHTLFRKPFGWFFRMLGGIPVDRSKAAGVIQQTVTAFEETDHLNLVIAPEGTRGKRDYWKAGFYRIALGAQVPIVLIGLDGVNRRLRVGPDFIPTGNVRADMDRIREFYEGCRGVRPDLSGEVRLRKED